MSTVPSRFLEEIPPRLLRDSESDDGAPGDDSASRMLRAAASIARRRSGRGEERFDGETEAPVDPSSPFTLGCKVHHPEYGVGTVIGVEGKGDGLKLTVSFSVYGSKKFLPRYAPLEKI